MKLSTHTLVTALNTLGIIIFFIGFRVGFDQGEKKADLRILEAQKEAVEKALNGLEISVLLHLAPEPKPSI